MDLYHIVEVDGIWRAAVCKNNKADKYGQPKLFTHKEAVKWIEKHSYVGMSFHYEIVKVGDRDGN